MVLLVIQMRQQYAKTIFLERTRDLSLLMNIGHLIISAVVTIN